MSSLLPPLQSSFLFSLSFSFVVLQIVPSTPVINLSDKIGILSTVLSPAEFSRNLTQGAGRAVYQWSVVQGSLNSSDPNVVISSSYVRNKSLVAGDQGQ